jgi:hypothetical protein
MVISMMRKLDSFEWLLVCLIFATIITGLIVYLKRSNDMATIPKRYPIAAVCR